MSYEHSLPHPTTSASHQESSARHGREDDPYKEGNLLELLRTRNEAKYAEVPTPHHEQLRHAMSLAVRESWDATSAMRALAEQTGFDLPVPDRSGRNGNHEIEAREVQVLASFAAEIVKAYPNPGTLAHGIRMLEAQKADRIDAVGKGPFGAEELFDHFYNKNDRLAAWEEAMSVIYGTRWAHFRHEEGFHFANNPHMADDIYRVPPEAFAAAQERRVRTELLGKSQEYHVGGDMAPVMTRGEMKHHHHIDAELRAVVHLGGKVGQGGVAFGILDTRRSPKDPERPGMVRPLARRPNWATPPGLLLVALHKNEQGHVIPVFDPDHIVPLSESEGEIMLGRPSAYASNHEMVALSEDGRVSPRVSREHLVLAWDRDGITIANANPSNNTYIEAGHVLRRPTGRHHAVGQTALAQAS